MARVKDRTGERIGALTVIEHLGGDQFRCKCDCGEEVIYTAKQLRGDWKRHCGCGTGLKNIYKCTLTEEEIAESYKKRVLVRQAKKNKCLYPSYSCKLNLKGLCCNDCDEPNCEHRCLNTKEKCRK